MLLRDEATSFDQAAFDNLIAEQGVTFTHWRSMACPLGMADPDSDRHPHESHSSCSNGYIYTLAGNLTAGFTSNAKDSQFTEMGRLDGSTATLVIPRFYDPIDSIQPVVPVEIVPGDRLYLDEGDGNQAITVPTWERVSANPTGRDRLEFPVVSVTDLMDSQGVRYTQGVDFSIVNGEILWGKRRPGINTDTGKGLVFSCRYRYRPSWYIARLLHEVRVGPVSDAITGERRMLQFPQGCTIEREYFFRKDQLDPNNPRNPRTVKQPAMAANPPRPGDDFGPRTS